MDGIEKITGRIAADTEAEIASIQAEARRQADEITARYEAQAKREAEEIAARGRRSAEERQARLASVAQLDARKLELAAKQEMLAKAYDMAMEWLTPFRPMGYSVAKRLPCTLPATYRPGITLRSASKVWQFSSLSRPPMQTSSRAVVNLSA